MKSRVFLAGLAVMLLVAAVPTWAQQSEIVQRVLVRVNGEIYTQRDLERDQVQALQDRNQTVADPKALQNDATLKVVLGQITPEILVKAVDDMLLLQKAKELGYKMTDDRFTEVLDNIKRANKLDDAGFKKALDEQGLTLDKLRLQLEPTYLIDALQQQEIMAHLSPTEQEEREYYTAHPDEFMNPPTILLREILVATPSSTVGGQTGVTAATEEEAHARADAAHDRLVKGEPFAKVATDVSDSPSKTSGGLLEAINEADLAEALRKMIDPLKPGQFTDPIRTTRGYQILELDARTSAQPKPFDQVRDAIVQKMYGDRKDSETDKYVAKLRNQALIEWKDAGLKELYEKQIADMAAQGKQ